MKKVMKIVGIVLLAIIVVAAVAFGLYWHHNTHWFDKYEKALKTVGAEALYGCSGLRNLTGQGDADAGLHDQAQSQAEERGDQSVNIVILII